jgi:hypothetical protein
MTTTEEDTMTRNVHSRVLWPLIVVLGALGACTEQTPLATSAEPGLQPQANVSTAVAYHRTLAELRRATAAYHDIDRAIADGFILLHECEVRPGEGQAGAVYVNLSRLTGGIDPSNPPGLLYEPGRNGRMSLVGAELAVPFALWPHADPPEFFGAQFQPEEEFGVYGLHVWIWRHNPDGMFAQANPRVSCEPES